MSELREWESLQCLECTGVLFTALLELRVRQGSGLVPTPTRYQCQQCGAVADPGKLQTGAEIRRRQRQILVQEQELAVLRMRS